MATDCSLSTVLPVVFDVTLSGTPDVLMQITLPGDVQRLKVEAQFTLTGGYVTYTGTDNVAVGSAIKDRACPVAATWATLPWIKNPALLFLGSSNATATAKIRVSSRG